MSRVMVEFHPSLETSCVFESLRSFATSNGELSSFVPSDDIEDVAHLHGD